MNADSLKIVEEPAPHSSIRPHSSAQAPASDPAHAVDPTHASDRAEAAVEPRISVEIRTAGLVEPRRPAPADYGVGTVLAGKYRVERTIGEGAMGIVLAATHLGLDERVAIKFMRPETQSVEGTLERFAKEAKIAARIRSEHVAKVLDVGEVDPLGPFIVMEYLEGKSLAELLDAQMLNRQGPLPVERVVEYLLQACEALAAAHAVGIIHRDVKPDNLFLTRHAGLETLKLLDFGISKALLPSGPLLDTPPHDALSASAGTSTTAFVMGTPLFMSPEQLRSLPDVDCRTDIWSLGGVLYELLSGTPPFHAGSIPEICAAILDATPAPLPVSCPAELRVVVMRCLEKDRERRYQTVAELAAALLPFAPGEARAYASRSSCILRASTSNSSGADAGTVSAAVTPRATRFRFHSSALVTAATVLALSALGVSISVSKMRGSPIPTLAERPFAAAVVASTPTPLPPVPSSYPAPLPAAPAANGAPSSVLGVSPVAGEAPVVASATPTLEAPRQSPPAKTGPAPQEKPARATSRPSLISAAAPVAAPDVSSPASASARPGRVRLVEPRLTLRRVERVSLVPPAPTAVADRIRGQR